MLWRIFFSMLLVAGVAEAKILDKDTEIYRVWGNPVKIYSASLVTGESHAIECFEKDGAQMEAVFDQERRAIHLRYPSTDEGTREQLIAENREALRGDSATIMATGNALEISSSDFFAKRFPNLPKATAAVVPDSKSVIAKNEPSRMSNTPVSSRRSSSWGGLKSHSSDRNRDVHDDQIVILATPNNYNDDQYRYYLTGNGYVDNPYANSTTKYRKASCDTVKRKTDYYTSKNSGKFSTYDNKVDFSAKKDSAQDTQDIIKKIMLNKEIERTIAEQRKLQKQTAQISEQQKKLRQELDAIKISDKNKSDSGKIDTLKKNLDKLDEQNKKISEMQQKCAKSLKEKTAQLNDNTKDSNTKK